jgi:hypothetical protein
MGPIGCPETSVKDYRATLRNNPEERRFEIEGLGKYSELVVSVPDCLLFLEINLCLGGGGLYWISISKWKPVFLLNGFGP